ncbi:membrane-associated protein [Acrasis kona]|uniref:Membrane-associated protein n=1 Tax=Acrasis kona TaxID=1008807 RepID=A0AAW2YVJ2_9EUKA
MTIHVSNKDIVQEDFGSKILGIKSKPDNEVCCDCSCGETTWASTTFGCFLCINCSGVHRSLGTHVSKVKSVTLDSWSLEEIRSMELWGNKRVNNMFESNVPSYYTKPIEEAPYEYRLEYITAKYIYQHFVKSAMPPPVPINTPLPNLTGSYKTTPKKSSTKKASQSLRKAEPNKNVGQVEFSGILNIILKRGIDMKPMNTTTNWLSDPYVILGAGPDFNDCMNIHPGQLSKSEVKRKTLNPEWNQRMCCCICSLDTDVIHIEVWDYDKLSAHEFMGEYHLQLCDLDILNQKDQKVNVCISLQSVERGCIELEISYHSLK